MEDELAALKAAQGMLPEAAVDAELEEMKKATGSLPQPKTNLVRVVNPCSCKFHTIVSPDADTA